MSTKSFLLWGCVSITPCWLIRVRRFWITSLVNLKTPLSWMFLLSFPSSLVDICYTATVSSVVTQRQALAHAQCPRPSWSAFPATSSSKSNPSGAESVDGELWWGHSAPRWPIRTHWTTCSTDQNFLKGSKNKTLIVAKESTLTTDSCCCGWRHISANCPRSSEWHGQTAQCLLCRLAQGVSTFPRWDREKLTQNLVQKLPIQVCIQLWGAVNDCTVY